MESSSAGPALVCCYDQNERGNAATTTSSSSNHNDNTAGSGGGATILSPPRAWFEDAGGCISHEEEDSNSSEIENEIQQQQQQQHPFPGLDRRISYNSCNEENVDAVLPVEAYPSSSSNSCAEDDGDDFNDEESENLRVLKSSWEGEPPLLPPPPPAITRTGLGRFPNNPSSNFRNGASPANSTSGAAAAAAAAAEVVVPSSSLDAVGVPRPSPSWQEVSQKVLPNAARELLSTSVRRAWYTARWSYAATQWHRHYSDYGNRNVGYYYCNSDTLETNGEPQQQLPAFSSLPWVERQMVREWRTYLPTEKKSAQSQSRGSDPSLLLVDDIETDDDEFHRARTLVPVPQPRPVWQEADACQDCRQPFGPTLLRHHCRLCGKSFCHAHSSHTHPLPHMTDYILGVPERVCDHCKHDLMKQNWAERVAWRLARCRDYLSSGDDLQPYFEVGLDSVEDAVGRITHAALTMAKSIPLGAQATVAVETVDCLRKYGLSGIYTLVLRQEFLAAADLLLKALGIDRTAWPLSVHELSAAIFYALAQHRALRGLHPDREHQMHAFRIPPQAAATTKEMADEPISSHNPQAVCDPVPDDELQALIFLAPLALNFIYVEKEVDMQLLAAQQGWRLIYAYLDRQQQESVDVVAAVWSHHHARTLHERPASALFVHQEQKIACVAVRGTTTIHDVITDIRQVPVPFPDSENMAASTSSNQGAGEVGGVTGGSGDDEWTTIFRGQGLAVAGMAGAAVNLYREHIDSLLLLAKEGYQIRLVGHSLGGSVAALLGVLLYKDMLELVDREGATESATVSNSNNSKKVPLQVYAFGTPSCVDLPLAQAVESFVTTVVLHDDVVPRLTPTSCRGLLKHLLHIRETWVKEHFADDIRAFTDRAKTAWAPRWRGGFTLSPASSSVQIKRYCRQQLQYGKKQLQYGKDQLMIVRDKLVGEDRDNSCYAAASVVNRTPCGRVLDHEDDYPVKVPWMQSAPLAAEQGHAAAAPKKPDETPSSDRETAIPKLVMDFMGGIDVRTEGIVIDGDEFFDPDSRLVMDDSSEDDNESSTTNDLLDSSLSGSAVKVESSDELPHDARKDTSFDEVEPTDSSDNAVETEDEDSPGAVVLEETPLPRMFIPGKIMHIYSHRGVYRVAYVPRSFRELRRISLAGNCLRDHKTKSYFDALLEVRSVKEAQENPPQWTAFDEDDTCSCCASRFTWASTSDNEAQEARDKHNCRSCGSLVCEPCSEKRIPIPSIGLITAARVCDRCYNDIDGLATARTAKSPQSETYDPAGNNDSLEEKCVKPTRVREKRSLVVDELAGRIQASALTCS